MPDLLRPETYPLGLQLLLLVLATYRVASLVGREDGPYVPFLFDDPSGFQAGIFEMVRRKAGAYEEQNTSLSRGITCPLCIGVYAALGMLVLLSIQYANLLVLWLAIAGGQKFLYQIHGGD